MKDYYQRKATDSWEQLTAVNGVPIHIVRAKLEDEKRVFDLRWEAACQIYAAQFANPNSELVFSALRAWDISEDLLKAAGVV